MKILFIASSLSKKWGGTTSSILSYYSGLTHAGVKVEIAAVFHPRERQDIDPAVCDDSKIRLFECSDTLWRYSAPLKIFLREHLCEYDLVHIHGMWLYPGYVASRIARRHRIPYIVSPHGMIGEDALRNKGFKKRLYWALAERHIFTHARFVHCITTQESLSLASLCSTPAFILPNGVEIPPFSLPDPTNPRSLLFIGRLHPIKGIEPLLDALRLFPDMLLTIAGSGEPAYEEKLKRYCENHLPNRVRFVGFADTHHKQILLKMASFVVVPSYTEVLSMVALESIAASRPVLITRQSHFDDIDASGAGILIDDNRPETIASGIHQMLCSDLAAMARNAYTLACGKFEINHIGATMADHYTKILTKDS